VVPEPVVVEVDHLLRTRISSYAARVFLAAAASGELSVAFLSRSHLRRATEIDAAFADLDLGYVDSAVMAYAEAHELPVLTFDFEDFRATRPRHGYWRLVIDEARYADETA
jgi:predicted nucleic acid-binding protein